MTIGVALLASACSSENSPTAQSPANVSAGNAVSAPADDGNLILRCDESGTSDMTSQTHPEDDMHVNVASPSHYRIQNGAKALEEWDAEKRAFNDMCEAHEKCDLKTGPDAFEWTSTFQGVNEAGELEIRHSTIKIDRRRGSVTNIRLVRVTDGPRTVFAVKKVLSGDCQKVDSPPPPEPVTKPKF
ncbi:hypothetical protein [Sphingosinicella sp. BN140058]|uniref:hypothetical protein n=1 Tax=Sphingosinicella sp. BN140058 TaxID=1892855 RepID=UPI0010131A70|nr:hypothetical protein [Sphingosinicella sp. BN140058]QAY80239.1 hypothetical protein ETR14_26715 [Sphingosinicella sp. BN140058]